MEKHPNPFDEFLKETLKGHRLNPPEEAKKAFLREAGAIIQPRKGYTKWYYFPVLVVLLIGIILVFYYGNNHEQNISKPIINEQVKSTTDPTANRVPASNSSSNSTPAQNSHSTSNPVINAKNASASTSNSPTYPTSGNEPPAALIATTAENEVKLNNKSEVTITAISDERVATQIDTLLSKTKASKLALDSLTKPVVSKELPATVSQPAGLDTTLISLPSGNAAVAIPELLKKENYFAVGVYYLPEWMFNTVEGGKFVNNFGIDGNFYRGRVSIRTGAGISISKGTTDKAVEYNDYLGTYNKLDSITFIYNESSHDFMPNVYTSKEKVWDSIAKLDSSSIVKRYTYLQVPLVLGFEFWQKGRLTVGVRIGTIMSVMLQSKQITGTYDPGENLVLGIKNITPDQVSINWQAIGGFNASVAITKSFYFEFEPQAKYYYQSIYEKSGYTRKPWSIGIRTAVMIKF
jgi:hypothetical protein